MEKGTRVQLDKNGSEPYKGTVSKIQEGGDVWVEWDVGVDSLYHPYELKVIGEVN